MLEAMVENLQRENLSALEKSRGIEYLINDCNRTVTEVANSLGISRMQVYRYLNILKLPEYMLENFYEANLNEMHARALIMLKKQPSLQKELFQRIITEKISGQDAVRIAEQILVNLPIATPLTKTVSQLQKRLTNLEKKIDKLKVEEKTACRQEIISLRDALNKLLSKL
jgi:ParB family chromosome partitioning protein